MIFLFQDKFTLENLKHLKWGISMEPIIKEKDSFMVVGMKDNFTHETSGNIPQLWDKFVPHIETIPNKTGNHYFGVCEGDPNNINAENFTYMACVEVNNLNTIPDGMEGQIIEKQTYAVFTHKGSLDKLGETCNYIWGVWLPKSGHKYGAIDFELYDERFDPDKRTGEMDIYVPILEIK